MRLLRVFAIVLAVSLLSGCGYNQIQQKDEAANAAWSQVLNAYQRRADLIPNLVNTVRGYAQHEQQVFTDVTEARARVGQINVNTDDPASLAQFQAAQGELSGALSRLMLVVENYPDLKANQNFLGLQTQLESTENRIGTERGRYIQAVQDYNSYIRQFPVNLTAMVFGHKVRPNFSVENERAIATPPTVDFGTQVPAQQPAPQPQPVPGG